MKQNINIFIMIGIIFLAGGQLQGLTRKQFFKLDQLKQKLDLRYRGGIPEKSRVNWLTANSAIIEQIKQLDSPTAAAYAKKQKVFKKKILSLAVRTETEEEEMERKLKEEEDEAERVLKKQFASAEKPRISTKKLRIIESMVISVEQLIKDEGDKLPRGYKKVNFSGVLNEIEKINIKFNEQSSEFTEQDSTHLVAMIKTLWEDFAYAIINNFKSSFRVITVYIDSMRSNIEKMKAGEFLDFDKSVIEVLAEKIRGDITAAYQDGFLVTSAIMTNIDKNDWDKAIEEAMSIAELVGQLLGKFAFYISSLNQKSLKDKNNARLAEANFDVTAQAIRVMHLVMNDLYIGLQRTFGAGNYPLIANFSDGINMQKKIAFIALTVL